MPISFSADAFVEGDFAQTTCALRKGDKPIHFSWQFNGHPLQESEYIEMGRSGSRSSFLTIDPITSHDRGNYTCTASNKAGTMAVHAELKVNGIQLLL